MVCRPEGVGVVNNNICIPEDYNKFDLPLPDTVNFIDVGIDITDVLRINDKVCLFFTEKDQIHLIQLLDYPKV